jgi:uncharacterized membrane protein YbhN (UPF0104 family)
MKQAARLALTLGVLALVLWLAQPAAVLAALRGLQPGWLAVAIGALAGQIVLSALRWRVTAKALGHDLPQAWALREYGLSVAANTFLPGGVLGDLARILRSRSLGWQGAAASVLLERLAGQVALGLVALGGLGLWLGAKALALGLAGMAGALGALWFAPRFRVLLARAWLRGGVWRSQAVLTFAILALNLAGFWAAAQAVGVTLGPAATLALIPLTLLAMLVPLTINGWGVREGLAAALWPLWGIAAAQAVAASVAFGLACMGAAVIGLVPWLWRRGATALAAPK